MTIFLESLVWIIEFTICRVIARVFKKNAAVCFFLLQNLQISHTHSTFKYYKSKVCHYKYIGATEYFFLHFFHDVFIHQVQIHGLGKELGLFDVMHPLTFPLNRLLFRVAVPQGPNPPCPLFNHTTAACAAMMPSKSPSLEADYTMVMAI